MHIYILRLASKKTDTSSRMQALDKPNQAVNNLPLKVCIHSLSQLFLNTPPRAKLSTKIVIQPNLNSATAGIENVNEPYIAYL